MLGKALARSFALHSNAAKFKTIKDSFYAAFRKEPIMPTILRIAWHDAGTYDKVTRTGGPNGSIHFQQILDHEINKGLAFARTKIEEQKKVFPEVGYADLIQAGGYSAVEFCGGLPMPFRFGRVDAVEPKISHPDRLISSKEKPADQLRDLFYRMTFNDQEIVALLGAHTLGRAYKENFGVEGAWTDNNEDFDNSYFKELLGAHKPHLLRLDTDTVLVTDPGFAYWTGVYAKDLHLFLEDYARVHVKLSELGWS